MITEQDLHEYNKWLVEVWNPNQLHIPFAIDAPKAFLNQKNKVENNKTNELLATLSTLQIQLMNIGISNEEYNDISEMIGEIKERLANIQML
jgi:hypothetical protein